MYMGHFVDDCFFANTGLRILSRSGKIGVLGRRRLCMNQTAFRSTYNLFGASQSQSVSCHAGPIASNNMFLVHVFVPERGSISFGTRAHMNTCIYAYMHIYIYVCMFGAIGHICMSILFSLATGAIMTVKAFLCFSESIGTEAICCRTSPWQRTQENTLVPDEHNAVSMAVTNGGDGV